MMASRVASQLGLGRRANNKTIGKADTPEMAANRPPAPAQADGCAVCYEIRVNVVSHR